MGVTRTEIFTKEQNELATMMKALAHPARIAIIQQLLKTEACICGDLVTEIGLAQATISQHLRELKAVGIIQGTIEGTSVCYCINEEVWNHYAETFKNLFTDLKSSKNCC
ncbi:ArsR/SmtB family transcription factor [Solitalea canadensis]|uniref:Putative transcriptional regulator n=1 Tax=Solitalea canadensis (strain ATCC 29591 / DSM 3403 / JCM 21819 / LMG 8368 / NBRC 15130 / NCIMB 12057 / USAM 9D) TaxID=929556 RepID=H8KLD4_SOLCM|nr:metalloregulator ArsR/SmtB family transcription factor [Solitalea canadensis]AFD08636.1 putative transcriptional regulator [Solitalea canadensis DSM 3403]